MAADEWPDNPRVNGHGGETTSDAELRWAPDRRSTLAPGQPGPTGTRAEWRVRASKVLQARLEDWIPRGQTTFDQWQG